MKIKDRIKELRRVKAGQLCPNPRNWRYHPQTQKDAMQGILAEVGFADALLARELSDGSLMLIDGHLRAEILPEQEVPVLILDVSAEEADKLLLTHDAITEMAEMDRTQLLDLMEHTALQSESLMDMLREMVLPELDSDESGSSEKAAPTEKSPEKPDLELPEYYQILIRCENEQEQEELYQRLTEEGLQCKLVNL